MDPRGMRMFCFISFYTAKSGEILRMLVHHCNLSLWDFRIVKLSLNTKHSYKNSMESWPGWRIGSLVQPVVQWFNCDFIN